MPMKNPRTSGDFVLRQCIEPLGSTITQAAAALGVTPTTLSELVDEKRGIFPEWQYACPVVSGVDCPERLTSREV
jgi:antitoxin HigA-1